MNGYHKQIQMKLLSNTGQQHFCFTALQKMYDAAISYGDGIACEAVYQALAPIYAQLGFQNYFAETVCHIVNFTTKWPLATRVLVQKNCSVNLLGIYKPFHCSIIIG